MDKVRLDKYLWAIRLFRTRTRATQACDRGMVRDKDHQRLKPAHLVRLGDILEVRLSDRICRLEVKICIEQRKSFTEVQSAYTDISHTLPPPPHQYHHGFETGKRQSKTGKPTKQQRRALEDWRDQLREEKGD